MFFVILYTAIIVGICLILYGITFLASSITENQIISIIITIAFFDKFLKIFAIYIFKIRCAMCTFFSVKQKKIKIKYFFAFFWKNF